MCALAVVDGNKLRREYVANATAYFYYDLSWIFQCHYTLQSNNNCAAVRHGSRQCSRECHRCFRILICYCTVSNLTINTCDLINLSKNGSWFVLRFLIRAQLQDSARLNDSTRLTCSLLTYIRERDGRPPSGPVFLHQNLRIITDKVATTRSRRPTYGRRLCM